MPSAVGRLLLALSTVAILHAAFSTYEHFSQLKALDRLGSGRQPPWDVVVESLIALVMFIVGITLNAPALKDITWSSEMAKRSIDGMDSRMGFASVNHRGARIFGPKKSTS